MVSKVSIELNRSGATNQSESLKLIKYQGSGPPYFIQQQGSSRGPPEIHPEQEDPLNLDEENDMIEGSLLNKSSSIYLILLCYFMTQNQM